MLNYYIDISDKRCNVVKYILQSEGNIVLDYNLENAKMSKEKDIFIFSPAKKFTAEEINNFPDKSVIICGAVKDEIKELLIKKEIIHCNMMLNEKFAIQNANLTAEGVLAIVLEKSEKSICDNNILILGGGRIATALAVLFGKIGIKFSIATFNEKKYPSYYLYSQKNYLGYDFLKEIQNFDVVVNTIPAEILSKEQLKLFDKKTLFIETASCNCLNSNDADFTYYLAPALPTRYCPESAGKYMYEAIKGEIKENDRQS